MADNTTADYIQQLRAAQDKRRSKFASVRETTDNPSYQLYQEREEAMREDSETVTMTKGQLQALLQETVSGILQKQQRDETIQKRVQEQASELRMTGDPEVDSYIEDIKQMALQDRTDLARLTVVDKLRKSGVTNWNKNPEYIAVRAGQHMERTEGETAEAFKARAGSLPVAGIRESLVGLSGGGAGSEGQAKKRAEQQK